MPLVTPPIAREHLETDLSDTALQRLIDDADGDVVRCAGEHPAAGVTVTETFAPAVGDRLILLGRVADPAQPLVVTETRADVIGGESPTTLPAEAYALSGRLLRRVGTGWAGIVSVTYTPASDDLARRRRVILDLVKLAIRYEAARSYTLGDVSVSAVDYEGERQRILGVLAPPMGRFA